MLIFGMAVLTVVGVTAGWLWSAPIRGRISARMDVSRGDYRTLVYGLPPASCGEYERLLRDRYGVRAERVAYCTVTSSLVAYANAYDASSAAAANRKYGHDIFKECWEEAQKAFLHQRANAAR